MIAQSNVTAMLVGKDLNILGATSTRSDLAIGQIGVFLVGSKVAKVDALSAGDRFTIATKNSKGVIIETPVIEFDNIKGKHAVDYAANSQRTRAIGFDGTSGSIEESNSTDYVAHVFWSDNSKTFGYGKPVKFAAYYSSSSATEIEIANGLAKNFNKNFSRETPKLIKAEILSAAAGAAMTGTGTLAVVNGSKYATAGTDATAVLVVGDYVRIGGTGTDSPVYKVIAINATNDVITLDTPYQGATATVAEASTEVVTIAAGAAASAGVVLTGLSTTSEFDAGVIRYDITEFEVELQDGFGATTQSVLTNPSNGSGTYWEVAENEWFLKGNRGEAWRVGSYPKNVTLEATLGKTYDQISINYATYGSRTLDRNTGSFGSVMIATEDASSGAVYASLQTVLGI